MFPQRKKLEGAVVEARRGHKLQGVTVQDLFVHNWEYTKNWPYVVLSRVTTRDGLFLRSPLSTDERKYAFPESLRFLLDNLRTRTASTTNCFSEDEYDRLFHE